MKIAVIGAGYVGLVTAHVFRVWVRSNLYNNDKYKIKQLRKILFQFMNQDFLT